MLTRSKMDSKTDGGTAVQTKVNARKKEKNYTREEDIFLCRAWMTTSGDPDDETDEFSRTFWGRVKEKYASLIGSSYASRAGKSLPQRWSRIRTAVSKFCAIYRNINDQNPNGFSEQDMIKMALLTYKKEKNENFNFLHCWTELRNSFKWKHEGALKVQRRNVAEPSLIDDHFNLDDNDDSPMPTDMPLEQSERQKLAKRCVGKDTDAVVIPPYVEASPLSAVSAQAFICSSGVINFDPHDHTARDVQKEASEQVTAKKKESNYTREEDVFLCRAWMAAGGDLAKGKDETSMTVWQRIEEEYSRLIGSNYVSRTGKSLPRRWHKIRPDVLKFCFIYENINNQNSSCYTEKDKMNMARVTYKKKGHGKFRFHHCWTVLRDSPKWNEMVNGVRSRMDAMYSQEPITVEHFSVDDHYDSPMAVDTSLEQPEGQGLEERQVGCGEDEGLRSPPVAATPLSALSTPIIFSRDMDSNAQDHVGADAQTEVSEQVNTRKKEMNYSQEEDILLCRAWMETKWDLKIGRDQSSETLWEKIGAAYACLIGNNYAPRVGKSLPHRWSRIRTAVAKFCSIYKNINDQKPSSDPEMDKINMAVLAFQKEQKEKFKFLHCWTELRHSPKWKFETAYGIQYRGRHAAMLSQQFSNCEHFSRDDDEDSPMPTPTSLDQPKEQELAVQKRRGQDVDTSSSDVEELLPQARNMVRDILVDQPHAEKVVGRKRKGRDGDTGSPVVEKSSLHSQDLAREMLELEREKRDTKIMLIDPTTLPDGRRQYFEKLQQKILERVCGPPPSRN